MRHLLFASSGQTHCTGGEPCHQVPRRLAKSLRMRAARKSSARWSTPLCSCLTFKGAPGPVTSEEMPVPGACIVPPTKTAGLIQGAEPVG